jgi:hypothetical protein
LKLTSPVLGCENDAVKLGQSLGVGLWFEFESEPVDKGMRGIDDTEGDDDIDEDEADDDER